MRGVDFIRQSACHEADPVFFESTSFIKAMRGLRFCAICPVTVECERIVVFGLNDFESSYDGIAGGKLWRDGVIIGRLTDDGTTIIPVEVRESLGDSASEI